uniref:Uncharacterized protein n=1 Tax=Panagrolaimus davidi TaxID=227884 RepID=A0A914PBV9_9BILA
MRYNENVFTSCKIVAEAGNWLIRNESGEAEEIPQLAKLKKRKVSIVETSSNNSSSTTVPTIKRVCELLIDKVGELSKAVEIITHKAETTELDFFKKHITELKGKKNSREPDRMMVEDSITETDGADQDIINISKQAFNELLTINRQELGSFPDIFANNAERDKMITAASPLLHDLCRAGKYGP